MNIVGVDIGGTFTDLVGCIDGKIVTSITDLVAECEKHGIDPERIAELSALGLDPQAAIRGLTEADPRGAQVSSLAPGILLAAPLAVDLVIDLPTLTNAGGILLLVLVVFAVMLYHLHRSRR